MGRMPPLPDAHVGDITGRFNALVLSDADREILRWHEDGLTPPATPEGVH